MFCWTVHLNGGGPGGPGYAAVTVEHKVYFFGGYCEGWTYKNMYPTEVLVFNTVSLRWVKSPPVTPGSGERHLEVPSKRRGHTAVLVEDTVYVWGGHRGEEYGNVLYAFDVDAHRWLKPRVSGTVPKGRYHHSACVLEKVMFIYGGNTQLTVRTNDIYKLDTSTMVWSLIKTKGTPPPVSAGHSATIIGTKMFVLRGYDGYLLEYYNNYNTIRVFDTKTNCWLNTPSAKPLPKGRRSHSAFAHHGELYIFGGYNNKQSFSDLWRFSPETFSWKKVEPKGEGPCPMKGMCCCMMGDRVIIFGGSKHGVYTPFDDL